MPDAAALGLTLTQPFGVAVAVAKLLAVAKFLPITELFPIAELLRFGRQYRHRPEPVAFPDGIKLAYGVHIQLADGIRLAHGVFFAIPFRDLRFA
jgi:hypothetical protein